MALLTFRQWGLGSRLGVAGTMIGAALASATTTVATAVYQHSLERSGARMRSRLARPAGEVPTVPSRLAWPAGDAAPTVPSRLAREAEVADGTGGPSGRRFAVAVGALAAFGLALLGVTGLEAMRGMPLSGGQGTTVGRVLDASGDAGRPEPGKPSGPPAPATTAPPDTATPDGGDHHIERGTARTDHADDHHQ